MRGLWILLVLTLVPLAAAQSPVSLAQLTIVPFEGDVPPLQSPVRTTFTLRLSCLALEAPEGTGVTYSVTAKPAWSNVTVSPATDLMDPLDCQTSPDGWVTKVGEIVAVANEQAPAFTPGDIVVEALTATPGPRQARAEARVGLTPTYYSIVQVDLRDAIQVVAPGGTARFPVTLGNFGNGPTEMRFSVVQQSGPVDVEVPAPLVLESKYTGNASNRADLEVLVRAHEVNGLINEVSVVNLQVTSSYAPDPALKGDETSLSLLLTVRSEGLARMAQTPFHPALVLLALGLAAWAFRR